MSKLHSPGLNAFAPGRLYSQTISWFGADQQLSHTRSVQGSQNILRYRRYTHNLARPRLTAVINNADACLALLPGEISKLDDLREALSDIISDADRASAVLARIRGLIKKSPPQKSRLESLKAGS
jgi:hypothetical protein